MPETTKNPSKKEEPKDKEPAKDDKSKEEPAKEESKEASKAEAPAPAPAPAPLPDDPTDRDVCMGEEHHKGTVLLNDLIRLHYILLKKETKRIPTEEKDVQDLAARLTQLMLHGKQFELSGAKDVPRPFLKGEGRFFQSKDNVNKWEKVTENQAKAFVTKTILSQFESISKSDATPDLKESVDALSEGDPANHSAPRPCDVLFLPIEYPYEENMPYEHQTGNKHLLFLASQHCAADTNDSFKRVEAAFKLVTSKVEVNSGTELVLKTPRYVIQMLVDNQNAWKEMERSDLAEFAVIFVFEVFLEKQIHGLGAPMSAQVASLLTEHAKPGTTPFDNPTVHDVLFGRGGMTNGHPGNRRFRDIIALHRPDYIRATKMDKPNVARRIVRAIRQGNPVGRFLKKAEDGKWYDVGDRVAAEKTSQGLRERSNTEKRQRSALREALRIRREDLVDGEEGEGAAKKAKLSDTALGIAPAYTGYGGGIPLSLSMKEKPKDSKSKKGKKLKDGEDEANTESLPPNAVDENGNILVTDYGKFESPSDPLRPRSTPQIIAIHLISLLLPLFSRYSLWSRWANKPP